MTIHTYKRDSSFTLLKPYCFHSKEHDYIEVTEWANGEGRDIYISSNGQDKHISLTYGEFEALITLWHYKGVEE
jgi:hypothetical protein